MLATHHRYQHSRDYVMQDDLEPGNDLIWVYIYKGTCYSVHFKHFKGILLCISPSVGIRKVLVLIQEMQTPNLKDLRKTLHLMHDGSDDNAVRNEILLNMTFIKY